MKRMLLGISVALLTVASQALAEGSTGFWDWRGPSVTWDRIEGTIILPDETPMQVGPYFAASARFRIGGQGKVVVYLNTGFLQFYVSGLSWADHYDNGPLGSGVSGQFIGTLVCDSVPESSATYASVDTPEIELSQGAGFFAGVVELPQACKEAPAKMVFLLRHGPSITNPSLRLKFVAYGAGRVIR
jgi:hypothetical protein